jgi:hypothetical protein
MLIADTNPAIQDKGRDVEASFAVRTQKSSTIYVLFSLLPSWQMQAGLSCSAGTGSLELEFGKGKLKDAPPMQVGLLIFSPAAVERAPRAMSAVSTAACLRSNVFFRPSPTRSHGLTGWLSCCKPATSPLLAGKKSEVWTCTNYWPDCPLWIWSFVSCIDRSFRETYSPCVYSTESKFDPMKSRK